MRGAEGLRSLPLLLQRWFWHVNKLCCFVFLETGWVSKLKAPLFHAPCNAGTEVWRLYATTELQPRVALSTWWTPAIGPSATPPAPLWWTRPPSRSSHCSRCWWPWALTSRSWAWTPREMQIPWPAWSAMVAKCKSQKQLKGLQWKGFLGKWIKNHVTTDIVQKSGYLCCSAFHYTSCVCSTGDFTGGHVPVWLSLCLTPEERVLGQEQKWFKSFDSQQLARHTVPLSTHFCPLNSWAWL